jgi:PAS domain S-box-containing protein
MLTKNNIKSDELYKSLFENSCSVMLIIHPETGHIIDANISACSFYGYKRSEIKNMCIHDINTLSKEQVHEEMQNAKIENRNYFNFCHKLANGEVRDVEVFSGPITICHEKVLYSIVHDVSARKLVEKQIEIEKNFSESLINSLPGIMYLFDEIGNFKQWNRNFESVSGFSAKEIMNMTPLDIISSEDKEKVWNVIKDVFKEGRASIEAKIFTKGGQLIPYYFTGARLVVDGVKYLVGIGLDITERKQVENEKENLIEKLHEALSQVKQLSGFLPICASCKMIRDDKGYWNQIETYIKQHSEAEFSHSICPDCAKKLYPDLNLGKNR